MSIIDWVRHSLMLYRLKKAKKKISDQTLRREYSILNWPYASSEIFHFLKNVAGNLNATPDLVYDFRVRQIHDCENGVYQVALEAWRRLPDYIYPIKNGSSVFLKNGYIPFCENEGKSSLIFNCTYTGSVLVFAYPHESSNKVKKEPCLLAVYNDCEKIRKDAISYRLSKIIFKYLELQRISSCDCPKNRKNNLALRRLASHAEKESDLFQDDRDRRLEKYRIDWTLGTAVIGGLMAILLQSAVLAISEISAGREPNAFPTIIFSITVTMVLYVLKKQMDR